MSQKRDYYEVLGISRDASSEDIKKAYRKMARQYHPDISKVDNAEAKFKEIQEAYEILIDPDKKKNYDHFGHQSQSHDGGGFEDFGDIFSNFFQQGDGHSRSASSTHNLDERIEMHIDFMDAVLGASKVIQVVLEDSCNKCGGSGGQTPQDTKVCPHCNGLGYVTASQRTFFGNLRTQQVCSYCRGEGSIIKNKCLVCHGKQTLKYKKVIEVEIPAGIDHDMTLKMPKKGHGSKNNQKGDLYITFKVNPSKIFVRKKSDIYTEIFITFSEAVLGTTVTVKTIYGTVDLKIPAGVQSGNKMRLKNQGVVDVNKTYLKGHQYVNVYLKTPTNVSLECKQLFQELAKLEQKYNQNKSKSWFF